MKIVAKIFKCNIETYKKIYKDAIKRAFLKDGIEINPDEIEIEIKELPGKSIQSQRRPKGEHSRTISVYADDILKYIIGLSNTGFDEDKRIEQELEGGKYVYGNDNFHSNSYMCQGINKIFEYYYDMKKSYPDVKLFFYLLDVEQMRYPNNTSNCINYRKLATIGFEILNLEKITFESLKTTGFSMQEAHNNIGYISFNKFGNDILSTSERNKGNIPSYLKCVDLSYDISQEKDEEEEKSNFSNSENKKYIYTFKALAAEAYDSFLTMWTLYELAKRENKQLEFSFVPEKYNFRIGQENSKMTADFPKPITRLFEKIGLDIKYETSEEVLQQYERERGQYETAKKNNVLRNQELFRNNMRRKGIQTKCYLCGCEVESILEAAHLWGVAEIKNASDSIINQVINKKCMKELIDKEDPHHNENFYKKYVMANSGDNGVWLCSNHHGLFDNHYYCFDSADGKVILNLNNNDEAKKFIQQTITNKQLEKEVLTERTKEFLAKRKEVFKQRTNC